LTTPNSKATVTGLFAAAVSRPNCSETVRAPGGRRKKGRRARLRRGMRVAGVRPPALDRRRPQIAPVQFRPKLREASRRGRR